MLALLAGEAAVRWGKTTPDRGLERCDRREGCNGLAWGLAPVLRGPKS